MRRDQWVLEGVCVKWLWRGVFVGALGLLLLEAFAFVVGSVFTS